MPYAVDADITYAAPACAITGSGHPGSETLGVVYRPNPTPSRPLPAVVLVHGGSFVSGSESTSSWPEIGQDLATLGYVAYDINYCFAGKSVSGYPTQVKDVQDAVAALTKPGFDSDLVTVAKNDVATWGGSAGATLAVDAAVDLGTASPTAPVAAMVGWSGGYDFLDFRGGNAKNEQGPEAFLGCDPMTDKSTQCQTTASDGSAVSGVTTTTPSMSLWNSTDEFVPVYQFNDMKQVLQAAGVPLDATLNGGSYATAHANAYTNKAFCPSVAFISTYLGQPRPTTCVAPANPSGGGNQPATTETHSIRAHLMPRALRAQRRRLRVGSER